TTYTLSLHDALPISLRFQRHQQSKMLICQMDELFRNLLFEIESRIKPLQGSDRTLKCFRPRLGGARRCFAQLSVLGRGCFAKFLDRKSTRLNSSHLG